MSAMRLKIALLKLLFHAVKDFIKNLESIEYSQDNNRVIGGGSKGFYMKVNDPRGSAVGVQVYWSFESRLWGSVCSQHPPHSAVEIETKLCTCRKNCNR
jgi:hypothetical protein